MNENIILQKEENAIIAIFNITAPGTTITLKNLSGVTEIDWGDGIRNSTLSHIYVNVGEFCCKIYDVTSIGNRAFYHYNSLMSVVIPDTVTSIGNEAFLNCRDMTSVIIGNGVTSIGDNAFGGCDGLTNVVIGNSVTSIGSGAFSSCSDLTGIVLGNGVTSIGGYAFYGCRSLTSVVIPDSVTSIDGWAFYLCSSLTSVYITDIAAWCGISFVNSYANPLHYAQKLYLNNELVTELVIPDSVTSIGSYAFYWCSDLTSVVIGDGVTSIGSGAFWGCGSLTSVVIGSSVTSIENAAFGDCDSLTEIYNKTISPITVTSIDYINDNCTYYVPFNALKDYQDAWSEYISIDKIVPYNFDPFISISGLQTYHNTLQETCIKTITNDLNTKLDKTGGIITGNLSIGGNLAVAGTTTIQDTETVLVKNNMVVTNSDGLELIELGGFAIKTDEANAYGIMYDPDGDGVKIGLGSFDENGKFEYTGGEDQFLATRADAIADGHIVVWDNDAKRLVDSGVGHDEYVKFTDVPSDTKAGPIKMPGLNYGIEYVPSNGGIRIKALTTDKIKNRASYAFEAVTLQKADEVVKTVLTNPLVEFTDDTIDAEGKVVEGDKTKVCETIGAVKQTTYVKDVNTLPTGSDGGVFGNAYIRDWKNVDNTVLVSSQVVAGKPCIPIRTTDGNFYVSIPTLDYNCANKKYVDDGFVAKSEVAESMTANTIVKRTATGAINTNDPQWGNEAANKRYVDGRFASSERNDYIWWHGYRTPTTHSIQDTSGRTWTCNCGYYMGSDGKKKVEYELYSTEDMTATASLLQFSIPLIGADFTLGARYHAATIAYSALPKPDFSHYYAFDTFTWDEKTDIGSEVMPMPFRGSGGFEIKVFTRTESPKASITFKTVVAKITAYEQ